MLETASLMQSAMPSPAQALHIWERAVELTRSRSPASFEQWFASIQYDGLERGILTLTARDEFVRDWVKAHFLPELVRNLDQLLGDVVPHGIRIEWRISNQIERPVCETHATREPIRPRRLQMGTAPSDRPAPRIERQSTPPRAQLSAVLNPKYTFPNFVVGPSNELAFAAAFSSAGGSGPRYNPLFIAGGTGLGKTHLMHAIAHKVLEERPGARVLYVSAEHFTNEFIEALQHHKMDEFRNRYRTECDLLLVDDIQFLAGREQTQEEFFHTFNALRDADKPIVVTSDKYPQQLQRMPERLVSRFTSGLVADIQVPQLETRVAIVRKKAHIEGILLSDEVAILLAQTVQSNVRELEGALIRLAAKSSLTGRPIDFEFARSEIAMVTPRRELMSVEDIQRAVCTHFRLSNSDLLSKDRHKSVAFARQVAMYLCRQRLKCSFPELGRAFGNRDHTTVMSAVRRVEALRQKDPQVNAHLEAIERRLASSEE
jgi:chromosomal replication initiator protein